MNEKVLGLSIQVSLLLIVLVLVFGVGIYVLNKVSYQIGILNEYCFDKEGIFDVSGLELSMLEDKFINCSLCNDGRCFTISAT